MAANNNKLPTYRIICVPKASPRLAELVAKSRTARLHALETDPTSFLSQHATEAALPLHVWEKRVCNPETTVLACVATPSEFPNCSQSTKSSYVTRDLDDETLLLTCEWAGFAAVRGPMSMESYYVTPDMGLQIPERPDEEARWHVFDLYTLPEHRGRGLARRLVGACIEVAVERTNVPASIARMRLFMDPKNAWLVKMYESLGFQLAGKATLEEGFRANALDESIPKDTRENEEVEKMWHTRFGLAMEQVVAVRARDVGSEARDT